MWFCQYYCYEITLYKYFPAHIFDSRHKWSNKLYSFAIVNYFIIFQIPIEKSGTLQHIQEISERHICIQRNLYEAIEPDHWRCQMRFTLVHETSKILHRGPLQYGCYIKNFLVNFNLCYFVVGLNCVQMCSINRLSRIGKYVTV